MYKYHCTNCFFVYNPYLGDGEIEANIDFEDLDNSRKCPSCNSSKEYFIEIPENINDVSNIENLLPEELIHIPFYEEKDGKIIISVGTEDEPFLQDEIHFCEYVGIFDENGDVIDIKILPENLHEIIFELDNIDEYEIRSSCSLHGVWKGIKIDLLKN